MGKIAALLLALLVFAVAPAAAQGNAPADSKQKFSFYGLSFGMTAEEVRRVMPTNREGTDALRPGHGITNLSFSYDIRGRLIEIRAAYERRDDPLRDEALQRALRERFTQPVPVRWREVSVVLDPFSNRAAMTVVFTALDLREEVITTLKEEYLRGME